ncbi:MAG: glycosyltransferase family 2 protein [Psychroserpens sp.]|nr:glycosyltransferase family 2 protein [Psychroserpens sp.]
MVKTKFPKVKLIANKENLGFSKGNKVGVADASGEYVCILNPDTVVSEDTFSKLLPFADSKDNLGILGCRLIDGTGTFLPESKRYVPTPSVAIKKMIGNSDSYYVNSLEEQGIGKVPVFVGAFMIIKRSVYLEVGGFDEDYFMYGDDIDLSYKISMAGYDNWYNGESTIIHYKGESTLKDKVYAQRFYGAMQIFYNKYFKSNVIFNIMVWFGIKFATWFQKPPKPTLVNPKQFILISDKNIPELNATVKNEVTYENDTEYILDNNYLSFRSIIDILSNTPKNCRATYKILPKKANFIIGSNSSKSRGAVISISNN